MSFIANTGFEEKYIALRKKENRIYSDDEVFQLPDISPEHPHKKEWMMRKDSMKRLIAYLRKKESPLRILEIGCGNGWLCNQISGIDNSEVTGIDINLTELAQAARVFKDNKHLKFIYGEIDSAIPAFEKFDIVLFAASIQYFKSLHRIFNTVFQYLDESGEIHIIDTHFYESQQLTQARKRTRDYYTAMGLPEMTEHYFHHGMDELKPYNFRLLSRSSWFRNKFFRNNNPFPWVCINGNSVS